MRAFVQLRRIMATHEDLAAKLAALENRYDRQFKVVFEAIRQLMMPSAADECETIGFKPIRKQSPNE